MEVLPIFKPICRMPYLECRHFGKNQICNHKGKVLIDVGTPANFVCFFR